MLAKAAISILRAAVWSSLVGGAIAAAVCLRTSSEFSLGAHQAATWFGLFWALAFVPSLVMELGVAHLSLEFGPEDSAKGPSARHSEAGASGGDAPPTNPYDLR